MGKKKVVIKFPMANPKWLTMAFKIASEIPGILSMEVDLENGQLVLVGEAIDAVPVVKKLRKKFGSSSVELVSVTLMQESKKEEKKDDHKREGSGDKAKKPEDKPPAAAPPPPVQQHCTHPHYVHFCSSDQDNPNACTVM